MGTRGAYGFYKNGETKVTYNHFDSYPEGLGKDVIQFAQKTPINELNRIFDSIELVTEEQKPTLEQIKRLKKWSNEGVSTGKLDEWYVLLREAQGNLDAFREGLDVMIDGKDFLLDSLFCEWAYIMNLDTNELEVYEGFNESEEKEGRYKFKDNDSEFKEYRKKSNSQYKAVRPVIQFSLENIPEHWEELIYENYRHAIKPGYETGIYEKVGREYKKTGVVQVIDTKKENEITVSVTYQLVKDQNDLPINNGFVKTVTKEEFKEMI